MKQLSFIAPELHLPRKDIDMEKWASIACDQHSADSEYWKQVEDFVADSPSTLHMMLPEIYLNDDVAGRIQAIQETMNSYDSQKIIENIGRQFLLLERKTASGTRRGLLLAIDLEEYDYHDGSRSLIRASEQTLVQRLPVRAHARRNAPFEMSHVLLLCDDRTLMSSLQACVDQQSYTTQLMFGGGRLDAYSLAMERTEDVLSRWLETLRENQRYLLTGDGNHSLAAAKMLWKEAQEAGAPDDDPRRWAMVEIIDVHDPALSIHPIHRLIFRHSISSIIEILDPVSVQSIDHIAEVAAGEILLWQGEQGHILRFSKEAREEPVKYVDDCLVELESDIDYIHGEDECVSLARKKDALALLLPSPEPNGIFPFVEKYGRFPRKAFSLGHAQEKRYYMELRRLRAS